MKNALTLVFRTDATITMGTGHVMRCLALAQAWNKSGGRSVFAISEAFPALETRLKDGGMDVHHIRAEGVSPEDAAETIALARRLDAVWIILDGYHFPTNFQKKICESKIPLMVVDDLGDQPGRVVSAHADIILNQNPYANLSLYKETKRETEILLGMRYILLRREFSEGLPERPEPQDQTARSHRVLVTLGGTDHENGTLKVIQALKEMKMEKIEALVVVGAGNPHLKALQGAVACSRIPIRLEVDVLRLEEGIRWADAVIAAGGGTAWEIVALGVPSLLMILAENQRQTVEGLEKLGIARNLGPVAQLTSEVITQKLVSLLSSPDERRQMSQKGRSLVDGLGAQRVLIRLRERLFEFRRVREEDRRRIWEWANDAVVRSSSLTSHTIEWEEHRVWFDKRLKDTDCLFLLATMRDGTPLGQVRFDRKDARDVISVSIDRRFRGSGFGSALIHKATVEFFNSRNAPELHAFIKPENQASFHAFRNAGYLESGTGEVDGQRAADFLVRRKGFL